MLEWGRLLGTSGISDRCERIRNVPVEQYIFPNIDIPVIAVAWQFTGLNPEEMEGRITTQYERILTTTVDNIEHIESTTLNGQRWSRSSCNRTRASIPPTRR